MSLREWLGGKLMALAVRVYGEQKLAAEAAPPPPEDDPDDRDVAVMPAVRLGPKAMAMVDYGLTPPAPERKPVKPPLKGSLQDRYLRELRAVRR